jgi:hypothetical protein
MKAAISHQLTPMAANQIEKSDCKRDRAGISRKALADS